jgi:CRP-like cAMP-binding protein
MSTPVENLYIFDGFSKEEVAYFLLMSQTQYRKWGETILTIGDQSNGCAYYINTWHVRVVQWGSEVAILGPGAFFGEIALIADEARTATIESIDDVELQVFLKDDFLMLINRSEHSVQMKEEIRRRILARIKK